MIEWKKFEDEKPEVEGKYLVSIASLNPKKPLILLGWYHPNEKLWYLIPEILEESITHWAYINLPIQ